MKKFTIFSNYLFILMAAAILGLTACEDDPTPEPVILPPNVSIEGDAEVIPGGIITLTINGSKGDVDMNLLTITENDSIIDFTRLASSDITSNPVSLIDDNASSFDFTVEVDAPISPAPATYRYAATVVDVDGKETQVNADVIVKSMPTIEYLGDNPLGLDLGENNYKITASPLGADLATIAVYNDGVLMDAADLAFNGVDFDTIPYSLVGDDIFGFELADVLVRITKAGNYTLTFEVKDTLGEIAITKEIRVAAGTRITNSYTASLLSNADGPSGLTEPDPVLGGLDLDTGENVSVDSSEADIIDLGLDLVTGEWRRQIQGVNGTTLLAADTSGTVLDFDIIDFRELIMEAFLEGVVPSGMVEVGDIFIANRGGDGGDYFIMTVTTIENTTDDDRDFYRFDIKTSIQ